MAVVFNNGTATQVLFPLQWQRPASPERPVRGEESHVDNADEGALPVTELEPIAGGQQVISNVILDGITADIGETIAVVIRGDGVNGVFVGRLAAIREDAIILVLTTPVGPIPAGTIVSILIDAIAAAARLPA